MSGEHRKYEELLPWYVTGSLAADELAAFEQHLKDCLPCNAALRDERRIRGLVVRQQDIPLGPDHGIRDLLKRIDRRERGHRMRANSVSRVIGYGLAAAIGGAVVWLLTVAPDSARDDAAEFSTLSNVTESVPDRIDIVFVEPPTEELASAIFAELGVTLLSGPSEIGRYTVAVDASEEGDVDRLLAQLARDPKIAFVGRSFIATSGNAGEVP